LANPLGHLRSQETVGRKENVLRSKKTDRVDVAKKTRKKTEKVLRGNPTIGESREKINEKRESVRTGCMLARAKPKGGGLAEGMGRKYNRRETHPIRRQTHETRKRGKSRMRTWGRYQEKFCIKCPTKLQSGFLH